MSSPSTTTTLHELRALLTSDEIIEKSSPLFTEQSAPWSLEFEQNPSLVVMPNSISTMQKVVQFLYASDLDYAVRNTGSGQASARDVIVSTQGFKGFSYDSTSHIAAVGAGFSWGELDMLMEEQAPGYELVSARCTWVGVTGSILAGGYSWLSHKYGLACDPQNFLDAQIILADGRLLWASEEPDLLWALRGGGGNYGVIVNLKLQAHPYSDKIFSGVVHVPYTSLREMSLAVAKMQASNTDPLVAMHVTNAGPGMGGAPPGSKPDIMVVMYDANGAAHARSEEGFAWLYRITGAEEQVAGEMTLRQVNALSDSFRDWQGHYKFWLCGPMVKEFDDEFVERAWKWFEEAVDNVYSGLDTGSLVLLEFMQDRAFTSAGSRTATAWPHNERRHVLQLGLGCLRDGAPEDIRERVMRHFEKAVPMIAKPEQRTQQYHAGFLYDWNDMAEVYQENWPKLEKLRNQYDPKHRFDVHPSAKKV